MRDESGQCQGPQLILHGGAGPMDPQGDHVEEATRVLREIGEALYADLQMGRDADEVALECVKAMERHDRFNAGRGSALQADGAIRMSAAMMDSEREIFSGVMGVERVLHPSAMAQALQKETSTVLGPPGTEILARRLGLPVTDCVTEVRRQQWLRDVKHGHDTVGCVVRSAAGYLCAVTSTGGVGGEHPGRQSDSATVAGTYCTRYCAISATGIGEQIVNDALAARLETRTRDSGDLRMASSKGFGEAKDAKRHYGWIALSKDQWAVAHTTKGMTFVVYGDAGELFSS